MKTLGVNKWLVVSLLLHGAVLLTLANMSQYEKKTDCALIMEASFANLQEVPPRIGHGNVAVKSSPTDLKQQPKRAHQGQNLSQSKKNPLNSPDASQHVTPPDTEPADAGPASAIASSEQRVTPADSSGKPVIGKAAVSALPHAPREKSGVIDDMALGDVGAPRFIHREVPLYPFSARRMGKEGKVVLRLTLDGSGALKQVEVVEAGGYGFTEAAIQAVNRSTFSPARRNGILVASRVLFPVRFVLGNGAAD